MIIVQNFHSREDFVEAINIRIVSQYISGNMLYFAVTDNRQLPGEILLREVNPTLVKKYQGIQIHQEMGVTVALFSPEEATYKFWDGSQWLNVSEPTYMTVEVVNQGFPHWTGYVQIRLQLDVTAQWQDLDLGYEVGADLQDWLMRFGLIDFLSEPIDFTLTTRCSDGTNIIPPTHVDLSAMTNIRVQPFHGPCYPATANPECDRLTVDSPIEAGGVQLHYQLTPNVEYVYGEHQISELPVITVRNLGEIDRQDLLWSCPIGDEYPNQLAYTYDLLLELTFIGNEPQDARTVAHQIYSKIKNYALIEATPFDLQVGIVAAGDLITKDLEIEGQVPSFSLVAKIVNLFVMKG